MALSQGFVQVYTGNGKGKTTAAIGQAIRAAGNDLRVGFVSFMKNFPYGEVRILRNLAPDITLKRFGNDGFVFKKEPPHRELIEEMQAGLKLAGDWLQNGQFDLLVLDEILVSIYFKLFTTEEVLELINRRPKTVELILTGRYCPEAILQVADLVTEMIEVKHYYQKGVTARAGIES